MPEFLSAASIASALYIVAVISIIAYISRKFPYSFDAASVVLGTCRWWSAVETAILYLCHLLEGGRPFYTASRGRDLAGPSF